MDIDEPNEKSTGLTDLRNNMLDHLSCSNEAHFKSQQKNEPDLTIAQKREIAEIILDKNPGLFLSRFGKYISENHLEYFSRLAACDYEVNFYFQDLKSKFSRPNKKVEFQNSIKYVSYYSRLSNTDLYESVIRNRRLEALRRLSSDGEYFSDDEMRKRNPVMFEHLVGQYLSEEEKLNVQSNKTERQSFLAFLLNAIDEKEIEERLNAETVEEEEEDDDEDDNDLDTNKKNSIPGERNMQLWGEHATNVVECRGKNIQGQDALSDDEKALLMNEFRSHVYSEFLGGRDSEFDYSKVDSNHDYDDLEMLEIDQQDKYFDSETPEIVSKGDASSDSSMSYDPPGSLTQKMEDLGK